MANTPAEVTHLLEEVQAKDQQIQICKDEIARRDANLQKWVRVSGGHVLNPNEEKISKNIHANYDRAEILQSEKLGLGERALMVLERQIKRFDISLRGLQTTDQFPSDAGLPSMLSQMGTGMNTPVGGTATPLQVVSGNIGTTGGAPNIANAAQMRLAQNAARPPQVNAMPRSQREGSSEANKRRRLNASLGSLPAQSSSLRQSSLGPGTPKPGTPVPLSVPAATTSRAGSQQPKKAPAASSTRDRKVAPHQAGSRKRVRTTTGNKKGSRRSQLAHGRGTPSTNASDDESTSASPTPSSSLPHTQQDGAADRRNKTKHEASDDDAEGEEEENDTTLYCYCHKVSFGDMVGCDNENCEYQWFHWGCVQLKSEPVGEWLCPTCKMLPKSRIVKSEK